MKLSNILICSLVPATTLLMLAIFNDASTIPSMLVTFLVMLRDGIIALTKGTIAAGVVATSFLWTILPYIASVIIGFFVGIIKHRHDPTSTISAVLCGLASGISLYVALPFLSMPRSLSLVLIVASITTFSIFMSIKDEEKQGKKTKDSVRSESAHLAVTFVLLVLGGGALAAFLQSMDSMSNLEDYRSSMTPTDIAQIDAVNLPILLDGNTLGDVRAWLITDEALQAPSTRDNAVLNNITITDRTTLEIAIPLEGYEKVSIRCKKYGSDNPYIEGRSQGMWWIYPRVDTLAQRLCILRKDDF